jgi:acetyl esterase/lipase
MADFVIHPLDPEDAAITSPRRHSTHVGKGMLRSIAARSSFDLLMESVQPRDDVTFEADRIGGIPGIWVRAANALPDVAILHLHSGWFGFGSAEAFRHLVGHIAARAGAAAFIPDYRLAPEHPFPAAVDDVMACYRGLAKNGCVRIAVTGDSAGGNLALVLASQVAGGGGLAKAILAATAVISPVTDLTLSGESYETRADVDPYFTREQIAVLTRAYLGDANPKNPLASPLYGSLSGLAPVRVHVGDDEVLLDDSRRYVERAVAAGVDATLDVWLGMAHGFAGSVGMLKASALTLDSIGAFIAARLRARASFAAAITVNHGGVTHD